MNDEKQKYLDQLLMTIDVQNKIINDSKNFDNVTKEAFATHSNSLIELTKNKLTKAQVKALSNGILTFWKESIGPEVETFWAELKNKKIDFERRDELSFALQKGRFRGVDQGIAARKHWSTLKSLNEVAQRFSLGEISHIDEIIKTDENKRYKILKKRLKTNSIPQTQYLKFGECMAYFGQCKLFDNYFTKNEVDQLYKIWNNFIFE